MTKNQMKFNSLRLDYNHWGKEKDQITGTISFNSDNAQVNLKITDATARKLLVIVSEGIVEAAKEVSEMIPASLVQTQIVNEDRLLE